MGIFSKFLSKIKATETPNKADLEEFYDALIAADLGENLSRAIIEQAQTVKAESAEESLQDVLISQLSKKSRELLPDSGLTVVMIVGVNGSGKTTSVAKLANKFRDEGTVVLAAADTFRAAAVEQLQTWGERLGIEVISGKGNSDPASVVFDAIEKSLASQAKFLFIDTAGRLHNKNDLMNELGKVKRVAEKSSPVQEVLLVIDATTGQNGLQQAKIFAEAVDVSGIILTKLDGSARGGIALAIENALDIPIKFIGTGETVEDIVEFNPIKFVTSLFS